MRLQEKRPERRSGVFIETRFWPSRRGKRGLREPDGSSRARNPSRRVSSWRVGTDWSKPLYGGSLHQSCGNHKRPAFSGRHTAAWHFQISAYCAVIVRTLDDTMILFDPEDGKNGTLQAGCNMRCGFLNMQRCSSPGYPYSPVKTPHGIFMERFLPWKAKRSSRFVLRCPN